MTRSIFDPTGPNTERSGSRYLGPDADNRSHMPESAIDGVVEEDRQNVNDIVDMGNAGVESPAGKTDPDSPGAVDESST